MRISDWSSDVCSSDLHVAAGFDEHRRRYSVCFLAASRCLDLARVADFGGRRAAADADRRGGLVLRFRGHAAGAADTAAPGDGDRAAEADDRDRIAVLARLEPVTQNAAGHDQDKNRTEIE